VLCQLEGERMVRFFAPQPEVVEVGADFLRIISFNFLGQGIVWTCSSVFQGLGNTLPSLASSGMRVLTFAVPAIWLSRQPHFELVQVWYLSVATVLLQACISLWLLHREFDKRLAGMSSPQPA
jgi:Na+-driven multidrug efflux pump